MTFILLNNLPFDSADLQDNCRNAVLGKFMTAWSQVEVVSSFLFRNFAGMEPEASSIIFDRIGVREQFEILSEFAALCKEPLNEDLSTLLDRARDVSIARNKIVHASWGHLDGEPARFWQGMTSAHMTEITSGSQKAQSTLKKFVFTTSRLVELTSECVSIRDGLTEKLGVIQPRHQKVREDNFELRKECFELRGEVQRLRMELQQTKDRQSLPPERQ